MNWDKIQLIDLAVHQDERGQLFEVIHGTDPFLDKFGQTYVVHNPRRDTVRAFHKHDELWDYFTVLHGSAKVVLVDAEIIQTDVEGTQYLNKNMKIFTLTSRKPQLLIVPSGIFHGWMSLEDDTIMLSTANREYNKEKPDEVRVSPDEFGVDVWTVLRK